MTSLPTWLNRYIDADIMTHLGRYTMKHYTHNHVAMLFQGRKNIAIGQNRVAERGTKHTVHAELDVIRNLGDISKMRGATLVVIRIGADGLSNSKPCPACQCFLRKCVREYGLRGWIHS
jgi:cytidine deaminase